jgi:tyrosyl-tRNA synthetase
MDQKDFVANKLAEVLFSRFFDDWKKLSAEQFLDFFKPKAEQAITFEELEKQIASGRKLRIKFGIDPTGPDVHLGHLLPIMLLRQFQKAGHQIHLIIGDFTAMIGDPSGRNDQRPALSENQVKKNSKTYFSQIGKFLDVGKAKKHRNSKWLKKLSFKKILGDLRHLSLSKILQREDFRNRIKEGHSLTMAELLYSYAQAIDSVETEADVEVGGRDQLLNFAHARTIMEMKGLNPEVALTTPVLEGIFGDGRKMSKSYGNYIAVNSSLEDKFGKIMSMPDSLLMMYYKAFADVKESELEELKHLVESNPLETKKQLAQFMVSIEAKSLEVGKKEREKFENRFSKGVYDEGIPELKFKEGQLLIDVLMSSGQFKSKSELIRLFDQNAINSVKPEERFFVKDEIATEGTYKVGKTKFFRIVVK